MHNCNARWPKRDLRICHAKPATLAIRLLRDASFQKKNASTHQQNGNQKRPQADAFDVPYRQRSRQIVTMQLALRYSCRSSMSVGSIVLSGSEK
jgi:hypothetical protein